MLPLITGQRATRSIWPYITWQLGWRVLFVIIWGDGLVGGEVRHMAGQKQRIWKHINLHRMEYVWVTNCWE